MKEVRKLFDLVCLGCCIVSVKTSEKLRRNIYK
jgi:hypothetical protein